MKRQRFTTDDSIRLDKYHSNRSSEYVMCTNDVELDTLDKNINDMFSLKDGNANFGKVNHSHDISLGTYALIGDSGDVVRFSFETIYDPAINVVNRMMRDLKLSGTYRYVRNDGEKLGCVKYSEGEIVSTSSDDENSVEIYEYVLGYYNGNKVDS